MLPVGGSHITNDIAIGLRAQYEIAEELKIKYGRASADGVLADEPIRVPTDAGPQMYLRAELCDIIEARADEILNMVREELLESGCKSLMPSGVVLTGGTAQLNGLADLAARILDMPVRIGLPIELEGLVDTISSPAFATSVGLLRWSLNNPSAQVIYDERRLQPSMEISSRVKGWLKAFLP